jgi:hypothetical protein
MVNLSKFVHKLKYKKNRIQGGDCYKFTEMVEQLISYFYSLYFELLNDKVLLSTVPVLHGVGIRMAG